MTHYNNLYPVTAHANVPLQGYNPAISTEKPIG